jgi:hypothetical protein
MPRLLDLVTGVAFVALNAGCVEFIPQDAAASPPQERCPAGASTLPESLSACPEGSLDPLVQTVSEVGQRYWDPQTQLDHPNRYVDRYGGRALTAVLVLGVNPAGQIAAIDLAKSSGEDDVDSLAVAAFQHGDLVAAPPSCAVRDGHMRLKVDMCVEVERPRGSLWRVRWAAPATRVEAPAPAPITPVVTRSAPR